MRPRSANSKIPKIIQEINYSSGSRNESLKKLKSPRSLAKSIEEANKEE